MAIATPISHSNTSPKVFPLISASTDCAGRAAARLDSSVMLQPPRLGSFCFNP
jgi:hypothetical protein